MAASERIVLGSRGSDLALAQARLAEQALRLAWPDLEVALEIIRTSGDEGAAVTNRRAGRKGMFTREIENQLLVRQIDLAVHSAKDLPSESHDDLEICATLPRAITDDVLITKNGARLTTLPSGATIATGSVRRQRQVVWKRPDLQFVDLRGNVPTRLRKFREHDSWDGIILAQAGLARLGLTVEGEILSKSDFLPAGGQGVIALQGRRDDARVRRLLMAVDHHPTHLCLRAEREFLLLLNGDCDSPVGVQAQIEGEEMTLRAQVFPKTSEGPRVGELQRSIREEQPENVSAALYHLMYGKE